MRIGPRASKASISTARNRSRSDTATLTHSRAPDSRSSRITIKLPKSTKRKRRADDSIIDLTAADDDHSDVIPDPEPVAGPSRPHKRRKIQAEYVSPSPVRTARESFEVNKKKRRNVAPAEDEFEEETWGAAKIIPAKGKGKGKEKDISVESREEEESEVPVTKMGPPRGVKKNSVKYKSKSKSSSRSDSKIDEANSNFPSKVPRLTSMPKESKPPANRFRASLNARLYTDEVPTRPKSKAVSPAEDDDESMDLGYPELAEPQEQRAIPLFTPGSDDGYEDENEPELQLPSSPSSSIPHTPDDGTDFEDAFEPQSYAAEHGGLSPDVPETQSQDSDNDIIEVAPPVAKPAESRSSPTSTSKSKPSRRTPAKQASEEGLMLPIEAWTLGTKLFTGEGNANPYRDFFHWNERTLLVTVCRHIEGSEPCVLEEIDVRDQISAIEVRIVYHFLEPAHVAHFTVLDD